MGDLPEKHDVEQDPAFERERVACRRPAAQNRKRPGERPDDGGERALAFEGRVHQHVAHDRQERQQRRQGIDQQEQLGASDGGQASAKNEGRPLADTARRKRAVAGPPHQRVDIPFPPLVERVGTAGYQAGADEQRDEQPQVDLTRGTQHEPGRGGEHNQAGDARLREFQERLHQSRSTSWTTASAPAFTAQEVLS